MNGSEVGITHFGDVAARLNAAAQRAHGGMARIIGGARLSRALLEVALLHAFWLLLFTVPLLMRPGGPGVEMLANAQIEVAQLGTTAILFALRLRVPRGSRWQRLGFEAGAWLALTLLAAVVMLAFSFAAANAGLAPAVERDTFFNLPFIISAAFLGGTLPIPSFYIPARIAVRVWLGIERRARRQLRWALTRAHLVVTALLLPMILFQPGWAWSRFVEAGGLEGGVAVGLASLIAFVFYTLVNTFLSAALGALVFLPLIGAFSFIMMGRITGRLERLAEATAALRRGNYSARVAVNGEDEVARLQADFNAMATELQGVLAQLHGEREKLRVEQERSERLLLNILPSPVAERLKDEPGAIADSFAEVTVLFADIVDFTRMAAELEAEEVVSWLNEIFTAFDVLAEKHGVEKIKTIGDAYMAVAGVPVPRADHAKAMAEMALDMRDEIGRRVAPNGERPAVRIGMNTGQVVAGVIGSKKFIYDLWGDTVNIASRMESQGKGGSIQVTEETYRRLVDHYQFQQRDPIYIKGRGWMTTYFLVGRLTSPEVLSQV